MPASERKTARNIRHGPYDLRESVRGTGVSRQRVSVDRQPEIDDNFAGEFIKVSSDSNPKAVAGKIAHSAREGADPPAVLTIGAPCVNQAVKAIAIARQYLQDDNLDLNFQPAFRHADRCAISQYAVAPILSCVVPSSSTQLAPPGHSAAGLLAE